MHRTAARGRRPRQRLNSRQRKRPPGFSTRRASASTAGLSVQLRRPKAMVTASNARSGSGSRSASAQSSARLPQQPALDGARSWATDSIAGLTSARIAKPPAAREPAERDVAGAAREIEQAQPRPRPEACHEAALPRRGARRATSGRSSGRSDGATLANTSRTSALLLRRGTVPEAEIDDAPGPGCRSCASLIACRPAMPELPEVETVMRGLAARLAGRTIRHAAIARPDLRWAFPDALAARLTGARVHRLPAPRQIHAHAPRRRRERAHSPRHVRSHADRAKRHGRGGGARAF